MSRTKTIKPMDRGLNPWTLRFRDPEQEKLYQELIDSNLHLPLFFRVATYGAIALHCGYRCFAIFSVCGGNIMPTGTLLEELSLLILIIVCIMIELVIRKANVWRKVQGFFLYCCIPIVSITAAYYTQKAPRFGIL
jgi:hypothetical protein